MKWNIYDWSALGKYWEKHENSFRHRKIMKNAKKRGNDNNSFCAIC